MKRNVIYCAIGVLMISFCANALSLDKAAHKSKSTTTNTKTVKKKVATKTPAKKSTPKTVKVASKKQTTKTTKITSKKITAAVKPKENKLRLYFAAALFNGRETRFNLDLTKQLESKDYQVVLPQRDGFEFVAMRKAMQKYLPKSDVVKTTRDLIYLLDMGVFIPQSDVVIANLDEPLDEGVIVEMTFARMIGKPVIGYRTDLRTPFGGAEALGGMHAFVAFQSDYLIKSHIPSNNIEDSSKAIQTLALNIDKTIKRLNIQHQARLPDYALANPIVANMIKASRMVFKDIQGIQSQKGLEKTVRRMAVYRQKVSDLAMPLKVMT